MSYALLANSLWYGICLPEQRAFKRALGNVALAQEQLLLQLLRRNADTDWGRRYGFATLRSSREYQARVPLTSYEDYIAPIEAISAGQQGALTAEPVRLLEPTSGSSTATKLVPYTAALKAEFQRGIAPWIADLFKHDPQLLGGPAYWSVSPVMRRNARTPGGIPIGFEEDSEYFGRVRGTLIRAGQAVPPLVKHIDDVDTFRYVTLLFLLRCHPLTLISVWNPTFLTLLLRCLPHWWPRLADDIASGELSVLQALPDDLTLRLRSSNKPNPTRAAEIRTAFRAGHSTSAVHQALWPRLRLVSCWNDGLTKIYADELAELLPQARLQGKGLLATEGIVSLPLSGVDGAALAVRSHFFEFMPADEADAAPLLAHELRRGSTYEVVLSTGGGLYRYQLRDLVEVTGHIAQCPLLRFVGKAAHIADHFGEKLNEQHIWRALDTIYTRYVLCPTFAMLACETNVGAPAYTLFIEAPNVPDNTLLAVVNELEGMLSDNFHYAYCRKLGQLGPLRLFRIQDGAIETYMFECSARGQRAGDIKPTVLHRDSGWAYAFKGHLIDRQS